MEKQPKEKKFKQNSYEEIRKRFRSNFEFRAISTPGDGETFRYFRGLNIPVYKHPITDPTIIDSRVRDFGKDWANKEVFANFTC